MVLGRAEGGAMMVLGAVGDVTSRILADAVMVVHFAFVVFAAVGSLLVLRWRRLLWPHLAAIAWAAAIVAVGFTCPLTPLEQHLRERSGGAAYEGGFIDHYIEGVVYPGDRTTLVRLLVAVTVLAGYGALAVRHLRSAARGQGGDPRVARIGHD